MHKILTDFLNAQAPRRDVLLTISNNGPDILETNYWEAEHARLGQCFLSRNAGVYRLLVPKRAERYLDEMRTGTSVTVERSVRGAGWWNVVFEDGSESPWRVELHTRSMDFLPTFGSSMLAVVTKAGKAFELPCYVRPNR